MPTTAMERIKEKFPDNPQLIKKLLRAMSSGEGNEVISIVDTIAERALYIGEMGHNLGAKAPK